jgi:NAD+ synthase (glutamine-hydrolysing)
MRVYPGVDSALVLALVKKAQEKENSPIKNIYPLLLPSNVGVTLQNSATQRGVEICNYLGLRPIVIEMSSIVETIKENVEKESLLETDPWAIGQLVSYARTPVLYYMTSLITANSGSSVICGTTNLDEGAYLGYVGKASDGMVDLQLITDLHKSEVFEVSRLLSVPESILNATPTGDMYDSRCDQDVFGAPYDFVEDNKHNFSNLMKNDDEKLRSNVRRLKR